MFYLEANNTNVDCLQLDSFVKKEFFMQSFYFCGSANIEANNKMKIF